MDVKDYFRFMHELAELADKYDLKICSYEGNVSPTPSEFNQIVGFVHKDF